MRVPASLRSLPLPGRRLLPALLARRCQLTQAVPFGPALSLGGAMVLLAGPSFALRALSAAWW